MLPLQEKRKKITFSQHAFLSWRISINVFLLPFQLGLHIYCDFDDLHKRYSTVFVQFLYILQIYSNAHCPRQGRIGICIVQDCAGLEFTLSRTTQDQNVHSLGLRRIGIRLVQAFMQNWNSLSPGLYTHDWNSKSTGLR